MTFGSLIEVIPQRRSSSAQFSHLYRSSISARHPASENTRLSLTRLPTSCDDYSHHSPRLLRNSVDSHHIPLVRRWNIHFTNYITICYVNFNSILGKNVSKIAQKIVHLKNSALLVLMNVQRHSSSGGFMTLFIRFTHLFSDSSLTCTTETSYDPVE